MEIYTGITRELPGGEQERIISVECPVKDYLRVDRILDELLEDMNEPTT